MIQPIIKYGSNYRSIAFLKIFLNFSWTVQEEFDCVYEKDVKWIKDLTCLKKCGLSIQEMKEYLELCLQGESTIILRKEMLAGKQEALRASIKELEDSVAYIDWKQNFYDEVLSGKRPYVSNLIRAEE